MPGANIFKLLKSLRITGAVSTSVKDPMWKYKWIEAHEPENFARAHKWLDVKEYLIHRCTGRFVMTEDSAFATLLYDTRKHMWSEPLCRTFGIRMEHLPEIISSSEQAGALTEQAASELGLVPARPSSAEAETLPSSAWAPAAHAWETLISTAAPPAGSVP